MMIREVREDDSQKYAYRRDKAHVLVSLAQVQAHYVGEIYQHVRQLYRVLRNQRSMAGIVQPLDKGNVHGGGVMEVAMPWYQEFAIELSKREHESEGCTFIPWFEDDVFKYAICFTCDKRQTPDEWHEQRVDPLKSSRIATREQF